MFFHQITNLGTSSRLDDVPGDKVHQVAVLIFCSWLGCQREMSHSLDHLLDGSSLSRGCCSVCLVMSWKATSKRHSILDGGMVCSILILQSEVLGNEHVDWSIPLDLWILFIVINQNRHHSSCESLGGASCEDERFWCHLGFRKGCDPVALV